MNSTELFIARRYLFGKRTVRFVNIITLISIIGITIGVAALIIVLSVFNGFSDVVTRVLVNFDPHLRIEKAGGISYSEISALEQKMKSFSNVVAVSPYITGKAMMISNNRNIVAYLNGVDDTGITRVSGLQQNIVIGSLTFTDTSGSNGIVLGIGLADKLGCNIDDEITVTSPSDLSLSSLPFGTTSHKMKVKGIFSSNNRDYDAGYAFISLASAQRIYRRGATVNGIEARLTNFMDADPVKQRLQQEGLTQYQISTWQDLHKDLYLVMKLERWSGYVILSLIVAVACFNLMGSLAMSIIEKKRDIGVLQTLGMTPKRIARSFIMEGMLVGIIGTALGIAIGLFVLYLQVEYQIFPLDTTVYIIPAIPVKIQLQDFISVSIASLGLSFLSAYYPAKRVIQVQPAEAIRWE